MNIFIYGSEAFKSDIHKVLDRSNIKFRLGSNDDIKVIPTLIELRAAIEKFPQDIFLIDDAKIFRKNALNKKIKFLKSNDSIEEEFLKEHGIGDVSINSLEELPSHIIKKIESESEDQEEDDYHSSDDNFDIQESIIDIVDEAYNDEKSSTEDEITLDDELSGLLSSNDYEENDEEDVTEDLAEDRTEDIEVEQNLDIEEIDDIIEDISLDSLVQEETSSIEDLDIDDLLEEDLASIDEEFNSHSITEFFKHTRKMWRE